jgi:hypothetical protein
VTGERAGIHLHAVCWTHYQGGAQTLLLGCYASKMQGLKQHIRVAKHPRLNTRSR